MNENLKRPQAAARNRALLSSLSQDAKYESRANSFGYTFKGVMQLFAADDVVFDKQHKLHAFAGRSWGDKGCALMPPGLGVGCERARQMDSFDNPVVLKNGVLIASPKLMSISNDKVWWCFFGGACLPRLKWGGGVFVVSGGCSSKCLRSPRVLALLASLRSHDWSPI